MTNHLLALPATFEKTIGNTTYAIDAHPVHAALLGALLCLVLLACSVHAARRKPGALISPLLPALGGVFVAGPAFVYFARKVISTRVDVRWASLAFQDAITLDAAAAAVGLGASVAAVLVLALRTKHHLRVLPFALPCSMLGLSLLSAARHAEAICAVKSMPYYEVVGQRDMHVGRERDVPVALMRDPRHRWFFGLEDGPQPVDDVKRARWSGDETVHVRARSTGRVPFEAVAHDGPVTLTTKLSVRGVAETASPLLSLRVGDRFVYRVRARSSDGAVLYFVTLSGSDTVHEVTVEVVGTRERDAFRTFVIEVRRGDKRRFVEVVALAGETRQYDPELQTAGAPIIASRIETSLGDPLPCSFALLDAPEALCQRGGRAADVPATTTVSHSAPALRASPRSRHTRANERTNTKGEVGRPPVAFAGAAPASFERSTSSTGSGLATALVAIATVGLVILPDGSSSSSYTLVETTRGPAGAAEAPPG